jgi:ABC-type glycerol-3-phosphate transport system substrate-binding protein
MVTYEGKLYALPSTPATAALHINRAYLPPGTKPPETLEELDAWVDRISRKEPDGRIIVAGFLPGEPADWNWGWGAWFGGKLVDGDKLTINSPENIRAFEWVQSYAKRFGVRQTQVFQSSFGNFASPQNPFFSGKMASVLEGVWMANYIHLYSPNLQWIAVPFPPPSDHPELRGRSFLAMDTLVIPRGARHPREAFKFIAFVQRQDEMEKLCKSHGKNSPLASVSEDFFRTHPNPYIRLFDRLARSPQAVYMPKIGIWAEVNNEWANAFQLVNLQQKSPREALDDAQARLEPAWRRYRRQVLRDKAP